MHFSFHPKGQWSQLNDRATEIFGVDDARNQVRVYATSAEAILELSLGFFQQFPLKKKFFYFKNLDPHFDLAITALSKTGLQARALDMADMARAEAWQGELDREAGIFLYSYDNPITGALHPTHELDRVLKEKSVFRITLSHAKHLSSLGAPEIDRSEIQVRQMPYYIARGIALAFLGERGRFGAITAEASTPCSTEDIEALKTQLNDVARKISELAQIIAEHEQSLKNHFLLPIASDQPRSLDRIVIAFNDIDGHAFVDFLARNEGEKLKEPGQDERFETASLSRWGGLKTMDWLSAHGFSPEQRRGMVVLFAPFFKKYSAAKFCLKLSEIKAKLLHLQNGEN